jgi:hypothetical protein
MEKLAKKNSKANSATKNVVETPKTVVKETPMKKEALKAMKTEPEKKVVDFAGMRKLFNAMLQKNKGLTLVENKHGAIQVKRDGDLLFSARSDGRMIVTHPMFEGKGKDKTQTFKVKGDGWNHLSQVPFKDVTIAMLQARVDDKKRTKEYHAELYAGKNIENSGLHAKLLFAQARASKIKAESGTQKDVIKKEAKTAKAVKVDLKEAAKAPSKVGARAIARVAKNPSK